MKTSGRVYLVGGGPGDEKLITIGAIEVLKKADVVIYDNLVNETLLSVHCQERCKKIYVGKSGSDHTLEQEQINELIVQMAKEHDVVVRFKGGDPFIFGRGGEEALALQQHGVSYAVIPGVSSAYAAPAYAGIPVTHRGISSSVAFITGHEDPTKDKSDINWEKLATGVQTLVFLMSVKNIPLIMNQLVKYGRAKNTPVAVIQNGTYPHQKTVVGTIETIAAIILQEKITPPSIVVVGEVVSLREKLYWFERKPLFGKTIVVTRSRDQASTLVARLSDLGAKVIEIPAIRIVPPDNTEMLVSCIEKIENYHWILFTSANGVEHFFQHLTNSGCDARKLHKNKIGAIGPATADSLVSKGIMPDFIPQKYISSEIVRWLEQHGEIKGKSFLLPRADIAPENIRDELIAQGASYVDNIAVYKTVQEVFDDYRLLASESIDLVTFTSSSTVSNFITMMSKRELSTMLQIPCAAIGPVTADTAKKEGCNVVAVAEEHTIEGLVQAVLVYFSREEHSEMLGKMFGTTNKHE